ncbi:DET1- and DDB1-associated protein 1-like [Myzus persicae]|uniref:DET1- and DDB1-associated protein 1-like n=1 Tax=Myzus persicae TaxID=13164 RepID=UPI000B938C2E|nr:DET1- and DDB1-associated protein 1-like [Myzus persicae]
MSIAEFFDGLPSFKEGNFSHFKPRNCESRKISTYIATKDQPSDQIIVNDNSHKLLESVHKHWDRKHGCIKRALEKSEESGSTRKRAKLTIN